jgi:hypothetical protein
MAALRCCFSNDGKTFAGRSKAFHFGETDRDMRHIRGKKVPHRMKQFTMREQPAWLEAYIATKKRPSPGVLPLSLSAHEAAWLFACNPEILRLTQVVKLDHLRSEEGRETAYQLAQDFRVMVTKRQEAVLDRWRKRGQGQRYR